jgi:hypothetical protein
MGSLDESTRALNWEHDADTAPLARMVSEESKSILKHTPSVCMDARCLQNGNKKNTSVTVTPHARCLLQKT